LSFYRVEYGTCGVVGVEPGVPPEGMGGEGGMATRVLNTAKLTFTERAQ